MATIFSGIIVIDSICLLADRFIHSFIHSFIIYLFIYLLSVSLLSDFKQSNSTQYTLSLWYNVTDKSYIHRGIKNLYWPMRGTFFLCNSNEAYKNDSPKKCTFPKSFKIWSYMPCEENEKTIIIEVLNKALTKLPSRQGLEYADSIPCREVRPPPVI